MHTIHTSRSQSQNESHLSHEENAKAMQLEIDHLKRKLCHEQRRQTPFNSDFSFEMKRMVVIDLDQRLLPVSLSCMMRISTISTEIGTHLPKAWEMM